AGGIDLEMIATNALGGIVTNVAELIAAQVQQAGFRVKLKVLDSAAFTAQITAAGPEANFLAYFTVSGAGRPAHVELVQKFKAGGSENVRASSDKTLDDLIDLQTRQ